MAKRWRAGDFISLATIPTINHLNQGLGITMTRLLLIIGAGLAVWFFISREPTVHICTEGDLNEKCVILEARAMFQDKTTAMIEEVRGIERDRSLLEYVSDAWLKHCRETANVAVIFGGRVKDDLLQKQGYELRPLCEHIATLKNL